MSPGNSCMKLFFMDLQFIKGKRNVEVLLNIYLCVFMHIYKYLNMHLTFEYCLNLDIFPDSEVA